jgi:hypothetical protein
VSRITQLIDYLLFLIAKSILTIKLKKSPDGHAQPSFQNGIRINEAQPNPSGQLPANGRLTSAWQTNQSHFHFSTFQGAITVTTTLAE